MSRLWGLGPAFWLLACLGSGLGACSGDTNWARDAAVWSGVGAERKPAPEFVSQSRPTTTDYVPVGVAPPKRTIEAKATGTVKAVEQEMDTLRNANQGRGNEARQIGAASPAAAPQTLPPPVPQ